MRITLNPGVFGVWSEDDLRKLIRDELNNRFGEELTEEQLEELDEDLIRDGRDRYGSLE